MRSFKYVDYANLVKQQLVERNFLNQSLIFELDKAILTLSL